MCLNCHRKTNCAAGGYGEYLKHWPLVYKKISVILFKLLHLSKLTDDWHCQITGRRKRLRNAHPNLTFAGGLTGVLLQKMQNRHHQLLSTKWEEEGLFCHLTIRGGKILATSERWAIISELTAEFTQLVLAGWTTTTTTATTTTAPLHGDVTPSCGQQPARWRGMFLSCYNIYNIEARRLKATLMLMEEKFPSWLQ